MAELAEGEFYTVVQAARKLAVNPSTVWRWIATHQLKAYRVGPRAIRIKREDLEAVIRPVTLPRDGAPQRDERRLDPPPSAEEIARRKALVEQILANREKRSIAPLTTTELLDKVRREDERAYARWLKRSPGGGRLGGGQVAPKTSGT